MVHRKWHWRVRDRELFVAKLAETGDPAAAAAAIGQTLAAVYRMRDRWPELADEWRRALGIAWEQVEMRVLSVLLEGAASKIDARVALAMLQRRPKPAERAVVTVDAARIAEVRSAIRALAPPVD